MNAPLSGYVDVGAAGDVPLRGSRVVASPHGDIAIFKAADGLIFALQIGRAHV